MLSIQDLTYRVGGRTLLENVSVNIPAGQRVGLVGPNGTGKSTLFRLIAGELTPDGGGISMLKGATLGMVRQDLPDDGTPILEVVLQSDTERAELMAEAETTQDIDRIGFIYERLAEIGAYDAPSRAATILAGLGFNEAAQNSAISSFSGGWRGRVALACALFRQPNVLLLDEPTNHLDFESMIWLENFMIRYQQTMIVISHDRDILNKTVDHILHLENKKLVAYTGNYDQFERRRAERMMNQQAMHEKQMAAKAHMMKFVDRFRASAAKAKQAQSRLRAIERMDIVDAVMADRVTAFSFPEPTELKSPIIRLEQVDAGYIEGKPVLKRLDLRIDQEDRIALLGANGNGKSTLVKIISGRLSPQLGILHKSNKLKIGYFAQFQTDELDVTQTPMQIMAEAMQENVELKIRAMLSRFGFDKHRADTKVGGLSGGEKARLLFCLMSYDAPHLMLLDEPTNHLDIDAREALVQAINNYTGAVILVSHDPHLVECVADQLWLVENGTVKPYDDDLEGYRKYVIRARKLEEGKAKNDKIKTAPGGQPEQAEKKPANSNVEGEAKKLEEKIAALVTRKESLEEEMAELFGEKADPAKLAKLNVIYDNVQTELTLHEANLEKLILEA